MPISCSLRLVSPGPTEEEGLGAGGEALGSREPQAQILNLKQCPRRCFSQTQTGAHQLQAVSSPQAGLEPNSPAKHQQTVLILPATKLLVPRHQLVGYNAEHNQNSCLMPVKKAVEK